MSMSKEDAFRRAEVALKKAQEKYDKAWAAWQEELDGIVLKPMHIRNLSRKEAIQLARAISDDTIFKKIMELGLLPETLKKREDNQKNENV
ncbi:MAG: hypothetical protein E7298_13595 [Lachnospiraceae bacterium]|nr:hypothetical protein [Lachnospiraceae bacterium]